MATETRPDPVTLSERRRCRSTLRADLIASPLPCRLPLGHAGPHRWAGITSKETRVDVSWTR